MMIIAIFRWTSSNFIAWLPEWPAWILALWLPDDASDDAFHTDTENNDEDNEGFHATHVKQAMNEPRNERMNEASDLLND